MSGYILYRSLAEIQGARFETVRPGAEPGKRLPGGLLYGFRSLPLVFG